MDEISLFNRYQWFVSRKTSPKAILMAFNTKGELEVNTFLNLRFKIAPIKVACLFFPLRLIVVSILSTAQSRGFDLSQMESSRCNVRQTPYEILNALSLAGDFSHEPKSLLYRITIAFMNVQMIYEQGREDNVWSKLLKIFCLHVDCQVGESICLLVSFPKNMTYFIIPHL